MNQISLVVVNTIYFKTILTLIRQPMYHLGAEILVAVSKYENTLGEPTRCYRNTNWKDLSAYSLSSGGKYIDL